MKKILLVLPEYSSFYPMMKAAFNEMGISHILFDNRKTNVLEKMVFLISKIIPSFSNFSIKFINRRLERRVQGYKPDLVLVVKGENVLPDTVERIRKQVKIINWFPDYLPDFKLADAWVEAYSEVFIADKFQVDYFQKKGFQNVYHLPWAGQKFKKIPKRKKYEVVFIGVCNPHRVKMFKGLKDLNFKIWGNEAWGESVLANNYMGKWLSAKETIDVLKNSKIVVNFHQNYNRLSTIINLRVYEATSCESLLITDYWSDLDDLYKVGKDLVVYKNQKDLIEKVRFYIENEAERKKIANSGFRQTRKYNTYVNRFYSMFNIISNLKDISKLI